MVVAASCRGGGRDGRLVRVEGKLNGAKYRDALNESLVRSAQDCRLGRRLYQEDSDPKHTAKTKQEWFTDNSECTEPTLKPN